MPCAPWRQTYTPDLLGLQPALDHNAKLLEENHQLIIWGPSGVGKTTMALAALKKCGVKRPQQAHATSLSTKDSREELLTSLKMGRLLKARIGVLIDDMDAINTSNTNIQADLRALVMTCQTRRILLVVTCTGESRRATKQLDKIMPQAPAAEVPRLTISQSVKVAEDVLDFFNAESKHILNVCQRCKGDLGHMIAALQSCAQTDSVGGFKDSGIDANDFIVGQHRDADISDQLRLLDCETRSTLSLLHENVCDLHFHIRDTMLKTSAMADAAEALSDADLLANEYGDQTAISACLIAATRNTKKPRLNWRAKQSSAWNRSGVAGNKLSKLKRLRNESVDTLRLERQWFFGQLRSKKRALTAP